jgi:hypothetical protein
MEVVIKIDEKKPVIQFQPVTFVIQTKKVMIVGIDFEIYIYIFEMIINFVRN